MTGNIVQGIRIDRGVRTDVRDELVVEAPLEICINGRPFTITMRTPGDDPALVKGLLFTEGVVDREGLGCGVTTEAASELPGATRASVQIPPIFVCEHLLEKRSLIAGSSCGMCGKPSLADVDLDGDALRPFPPLQVSRLPGMAELMQEAQPTFAATGGSHAAAAFDASGNLLRICEDIGRHNAVDKAVGHLLDEQRLDDAHLLFVSGRISLEIVSKARRAGIGYLAAVSAPSSMAVAQGRRWGMTLIGFCRGPRATVYSHPEHVQIGVKAPCERLPRHGKPGPSPS